MGIGWVLRFDRKAGVIGFDESRQEGIGRMDMADTLEPQFFDEAILQSLIGAFDSSFGLWCVGVYRFNIKHFEGT